MNRVKLSQDRETKTFLSKYILPDTVPRTRNTQMIERTRTASQMISSQRWLGQVERGVDGAHMLTDVRRICFRKVFGVVVEPPAGWLGGAVNAVLRPELLRGTTQAVQPAHRPPAHLTIEIFPIDSRLRLAEDDHPLLRHGLLIVIADRAPREREREREGERETTDDQASTFVWVRHHTRQTTHATRHASRATRHLSCPRRAHRETSCDFLYYRTSETLSVSSELTS